MKKYYIILAFVITVILMSILFLIEIPSPSRPISEVYQLEIK